MWYVVFELVSLTEGRYKAHYFKSDKQATTFMAAQREKGKTVKGVYFWSHDGHLHF